MIGLRYGCRIKAKDLQKQKRKMESSLVMFDLSNISDDNFDREVIHSDKPTLVIFWADWCSPCKALAPIIEELASKYRSRVKFNKINVELNHITPVRFGIRTIPALILFKGGKVKQIIVGTHPKKYIEEELKKLLY